MLNVRFQRRAPFPLCICLCLCLCTSLSELPQCSWCQDLSYKEPPTAETWHTWSYHQPQFRWICLSWFYFSCPILDTFICSHRCMYFLTVIYFVFLLQNKLLLVIHYQKDHSLWLIGQYVYSCAVSWKSQCNTWSSVQTNVIVCSQIPNQILQCSKIARNSRNCVMWHTNSLQKLPVSIIFIESQTWKSEKRRVLHMLSYSTCLLRTAHEPCNPWMQNKKICSSGSNKQSWVLVIACEEHTQGLVP